MNATTNSLWCPKRVMAYKLVGAGLAWAGVMYGCLLLLHVEMPAVDFFCGAWG